MCNSRVTEQTQTDVMSTDVISFSRRKPDGRYARATFRRSEKLAYCARMRRTVLITCARTRGCASGKPIGVCADPLRPVRAGRHVFPEAPAAIPGVSRLPPSPHPTQPRKAGNIGAISAYTNSHRVDLHTYRRFGSAAWLELHVHAICTEERICNLERCPGRHGHALFQMSNLEIYGSAASRARP